ncbi:MAG TPA: ABC transporter substrate-binding protein, partial [Candidatus Eisenbacteria bacterium]|nr:ABC transporter substrate-binding protein [Candidatus Eisenbacteria bacterium]
MSRAALAGAGSICGLQSHSHAAEPPPETTKLRLAHSPAICVAPNYIAEELLPGEGFTDVRYVRTGGGVATMKAVASGQVDLSMLFSGPSLIQIDAGDPIVILAGVHVGCFELFVSDRVRSIRDLKGKTAAVIGLGTSPHVFLASMVSYVGLDPRKDIHWVTHPAAESMRLLSEGKIDAFMAFPPEPQELRAKKIGHVVVNSMMDRPWSQYFCCMVAANKEFIRKHPAATKRALRAILRATDITAREPERVARFLVERGYTKNYDYALQSMKEIPYGMWRQYD